MTICIVARAGSQLVGATDTMLSTGDIQFEPATGSKLVVLTTSVFIMTAGDAALQAEICTAVTRDVQTRVTAEPENWWLVSDVAALYINHYSAIKNKRAEQSILVPLNLTLETYIAQQHLMSEKLVGDLARELMNFEVPGVAAIVAGVDTTGAHIYEIHGSESNCMDGVAFSAIGSGGRHASSQFMLAGHAWNAPFADTLVLTYISKRRSEVAPGVGARTNMVVVGPGLGSLVHVGDNVVKRLQTEYSRLARAENRALETSKEHIVAYVEEITANQQAGAAAGQDAPPAAAGGDAPANQPAADG